MHRIVDDQATQARASLTGGTDCREGDAADGEFEIGGGGDDGCVVSAELEDQPTESSGDDRGDGASHPRRAGGRHDGDVRMRGERGTDVGTALQNLVEMAWGPDLGGGALQQGVTGQGGQRRLVGRLPQHWVSGDEGQCGIP